MKKITFFFFLQVSLIYHAQANSSSTYCKNYGKPQISFISFQSLNLGNQESPFLTIKGKLQIPQISNKNCQTPEKFPAVVILHGSAGIDFRGNFYAQALNKNGIATLEIDMWEARGVQGGENRPALPIYTYPDAFSALSYLSGLSSINQDKIGVLGFSWGGVVSLATAEESNVSLFSNGKTFAAHAANYPVCYGFNNPSIPPLNPPAARGTQFLYLTGAPILIQVGSEDDYDNGIENCENLKNDVITGGDLIEVIGYQEAYHAWDRLLVPIEVQDPFGNEGSIFSTGIVPTVKMIPNADMAYKSRRKIVQFFMKSLY